MTKRAMTRKEAKAYKAKKAAQSDALAKRALEGGDIYCSCAQLKHINDNSIDSDYNRNICYEEFVELFEMSMRKKNMWRGERDTYVLLGAWMIHEHKGGEQCEQHVRASIYTDNAEGIGNRVMIDVRMKDWMRLLAATELYEKRKAREAA